jgi:succinate dehydrogenase / fumarate reductase cytochrome b subunit
LSTMNSSNVVKNRQLISEGAATVKAHSSFLQSRVASVVSILPLGVWTIAHLWHALAAFDGASAWQEAMTEYPHPFAQAMTAIVVLLPLAIHAIWGVGRLAVSRPNNVRYRSLWNFRYLLQRVSAVGVLLFIGAHLWLALLKPRLVERHPESFADLAQHMHFHTPTLVIYLLGTLGVSYHLANGVQTFCMSWGLVSGRRGLQRLDWIAWGLFFVLLAMSWGAIYALWAAGTAAG